MLGLCEHGQTPNFGLSMYCTNGADRLRRRARTARPFYFDDRNRFSPDMIKCSGSNRQRLLRGFRGISECVCVSCIENTMQNHT